MEGEKICPVCFESLEEQGLQLSCGHQLHLQCYNELRLSQNNKCPVCNKIINHNSGFNNQQLPQVQDLRNLNQLLGLNPLNLIFALLRTQMNEQENDNVINLQQENQIPMLSVEALLQVIRHTIGQIRNKELRGAMIQDMISTYMDFMSTDEIELLMLSIHDIIQD